MWMVWSDDQGLCGIFDNRDEALKEYESLMESHIDSFDGEFAGEERVVLSKIERQLYCYDTRRPVVDGDGVKTGDTYWDWDEDKY
jgi:hypothetical protein